MSAMGAVSWRSAIQRFSDARKKSARNTTRWIIFTGRIPADIGASARFHEKVIPLATRRVVPLPTHTVRVSVTRAEALRAGIVDDKEFRTIVIMIYYTRAATHKKPYIGFQLHMEKPAYVDMMIPMVVRLAFSHLHVTQDMVTVNVTNINRRPTTHPGATINVMIMSNTKIPAGLTAVPNMVRQSETSKIRYRTMQNPENGDGVSVNITGDGMSVMGTKSNTFADDVCHAVGRTLIDTPCAVLLNVTEVDGRLVYNPAVAGPIQIPWEPSIVYDVNGTLIDSLAIDQVFVSTTIPVTATSSAISLYEAMKRGDTNRPASGSSAGTAR